MNYQSGYKGFIGLSRALLLGGLLAVILSVSPKPAQAEAFIVLQYNDATDARGGMGSGSNSGSGDNSFAGDFDYTTSHVVRKNDTLAKIIYKYYRGSGLNRDFLELAIIKANPKAFVRENPNYLFAGRTIKLPSVNQISAMMLGQGKAPVTSGARDDDEIYFIGN